MAVRRVAGYCPVCHRIRDIRGPPEGAVGPEGLSPERYAAWYGVARVLLNLDETFARE